MAESEPGESAGSKMGTNALPVVWLNPVHVRKRPHASEAARRHIYSSSWLGHAVKSEVGPHTNI